MHTLQNESEDPAGKTLKEVKLILTWRQIRWGSKFSMWWQPTIEQPFQNMLMNKLIFSIPDIKWAPVIFLLAREQMTIFTSFLNTVSHPSSANLCSLQASKASIITEAAQAAWSHRWAGRCYQKQREQSPVSPRPGLKCHAEIIKVCFLSVLLQLCFRRVSLFLCTLLCLFNSLFVSCSTCLNAYIFSRRQKSRWHTAVHQSQSSDMVIKSPSSRRAPAYQNTDTHTHTRARVVTPIAKQHKQKAILIKATGLNTGSILLILSLCSKCIQTPFFPFSLALTCPVVSRLCVRPIVARTTVGASAREKRRRSRMEKMSRIRKRQEISLNTFTAAEKSVFAEMNDHQNKTFTNILLNTFGYVNSRF